MKKILFVAAEGLPFVKTGGLGDVIGSLPGALRAQGLDVRVMLPLYGEIPSHYREQMEPVKELTVPLGWRNQYCGVKSLDYQGVPCYFIDNEYYYKRNGIYGFYDDGERFAFFCRAALAALPAIDFIPDIIHGHDWHTGILGAFREAFYPDHPGFQALRLVYTIHNLAYQGIFPIDIRGDLLGLDAAFPLHKIEHNHLINYMKAGIVYADAVTTVSPTYTAEIQQPFYGEGLDGLLRDNRQKLAGILNGVDYRDFNPAADPALYCNFGDPFMAKAGNKLQLQKELGLETREDAPLLALISRLTKQKGLELLNHIAEELLALGAQLAVLGTGEEYYQNVLTDLAAAHRGRMAVRIGFDDALARRMYAAADLFLMPSLFEPCGLGQLIAMRYGSIPVVRETGGLKDTVRAYFEGASDGAEAGNGFTFVDFNAHELLFAVKRALEFYRRRDAWQKIVRNALSADYSWEHSAGEYVKLYRSLA